jgi:hypothetical protein
MGKAKAALACLCLAGCAVAEYPYPPAWDPLVQRPDGDCRELLGRYADRGERDDDAIKPSLTRQLFGEFADWEKATTVQLAMPNDGALVVTVDGEGGSLFSRTLLRSSRDYDCRGGRLIFATGASSPAIMSSANTWRSAERRRSGIVAQIRWPDDLHHLRWSARRGTGTLPGAAQ